MFNLAVTYSNLSERFETLFFAGMEERREGRMDFVIRWK